MSDFLISVVIPTYNRAYVIKRAIKSVLQQTYPHFEAIIVDDGSTDNTTEIVASFCDSRLHYVRLAENRGVNAARNAGIRAACGEWIAFLDSDDEFLPEAMEVMKDSCRKVPTSVRVVCFPLSHSQDGRTTGFVPTQGQETALIPYEDVVLKQNITGDMLYCAKKILFQEEYTFPEWINGLESLFWSRVAKRWQFLFVNRVLGVVHNWPQATSHLSYGRGLRWPEIFATGFQQHMQEHREVFLRYPDQYALWCRRIAFCHAVAGRRLKAWAWAWKALRAAPSQWMRTLRTLSIWILLGPWLRHRRLRKQAEVYNSFCHGSFAKDHD